MKHHNIKKMENIILILTIITSLVWLISCAKRQQIKPIETVHAIPNCVDLAVHYANTFHNAHSWPVRIAISTTTLKGIDHAQAQACDPIFNRWVWLIESNSVIKIGDRQDKGIWKNKIINIHIPYKYLILGEIRAELKAMPGNLEDCLF